MNSPKIPLFSLFDVTVKSIALTLKLLVATLRVGAKLEGDR